MYEGTMRRYSKISNILVVLSVLLPLAAFAQLKTVTTVTSPTAPAPTKTSVTSPLIGAREGTDISTIGALKAPTAGVIAPTTQTQTQAIKALPTTGVVAPIETAAPSTAVTAPTGSFAPQKTTTAFPFTPTVPSRASDASAAVNQYAAAQIIYRAEHVNRLLEVAEQRGEASAAPLLLDQLPGNPTIGISAASGKLTVTIAGAGRYSVNAAVYDIDRNALAQFDGGAFVVPWATYKNPASFVANIAFLPTETPTFFEGKLGGGLRLPQPTGVTPVAPTAPTAPTKPVAVKPIAPEAPSEVFELTLPLVAIKPAPGAGGIVREIPRGEAPEEILPEEEVSEEEIVEAPTEEELLPEEEPEEEVPAEAEEEIAEVPEEEPTFFDQFTETVGDIAGGAKDFVLGLFGIGEEAEVSLEEEFAEEILEEVPPEEVEAELAFEEEEAFPEEEFGEEIAPEEVLEEEVPEEIGALELGPLAVSEEGEAIGEFGLEDLSVFAPEFVGGEEEEALEEFAEEIAEAPSEEELLSEEAFEEEAPAEEVVLALAFIADSANPIPTEASDRMLTLDVAAEEDLNLFGTISEATLILERAGTVTSIDGTASDSQIVFEFTDDDVLGLLDGPAGASARLTVLTDAGNITFIYYLGSVGAEEAAL